jgi:hypothetical protein
MVAENTFNKWIVYVIGEIVLVMVGILLALQVNNWNEDRIERKHEQILLNGLKSEMTDNLQQLEEVIVYNRRSHLAAGKLLEIYNSGHRQYRPEYLDSLFAQVQWAWTFNPRLGIVNSIKTTGKIGSIRNPTIQDFITSFEERANDTAEESLITRSLIVDKYVLAVSRYISLNARARYLGFKVNRSRFPSNHAAIFQDREIESLISYIFIWRENEIDELSNLQVMLSKHISIVSNDLQ